MSRIFIEKKPANLKPHVDAIIALSNTEREALGFLTSEAYLDAIAQKRLRAMMEQGRNGDVALLGYLLHGGVYPHARIQQICVRSEWRNRRIASALMDSLVSDLEKAGFLTVKAHIANDLPRAQSFYHSHKFELALTRRGGVARGRTISVRVRNLDTPNLFSISPTLNNALPLNFGSEASFYTFDLNVLFDLVKDRSRHEAACSLFGAALNHRIRLGVAAEFIDELKRTSHDLNNDPVLQMALQLPRLAPTPNKANLDQMSESIHKIVFVDRGVPSAGSKQAHSDARHLAHSALSRVAGFITSDGAILAARDELLSIFRIDVASLDELLTLLPESAAEYEAVERQGAGFECRMPSVAEAVSYFKRSGIPQSVIADVCDPVIGRPDGWRLAIWENSKIVAAAFSTSPLSTSGFTHLLISVDAGNLDRELYAEHLLDAALNHACSLGPAAIRLVNVAGQPTLSSLAKARGFMARGGGHDLTKVAIGCPITPRNWDAVRHQARRKAQLHLPVAWPEFSYGEAGLSVALGSEHPAVLPPERFEDLFGPTIYLWPGRQGVLVPIRQEYADELLGTALQSRLSFIEDRDASFLAKRAYVNTPRALKAMKPGLPILFYETVRGGGRGAIVAIGRIVDSVIVPKEATLRDAARRVVVDNVADFSTTGDVLVTTFDNLLRFPTPVALPAMKAMGAQGASNMISATPVSHENLAAIVETAWAK